MRSLRSSTPFRYPAGVCSIDVLTILEVGVGDALERGDFVASTALDREVLQVQELFHGLIRSRAKEGSLSIPRRLPKLALSMALLFATKETAMISVAVLVIAVAVTRVYRVFWGSIGGTTKKKNKVAGSAGERDYRAFFEKAGGSSRLTVWLVIAFAVFVGVYVLFYSSFFKNYPQAAHFFTYVGNVPGIDYSCTCTLIWLIKHLKPEDPLISSTISSCFFE